jgi:hypothetical protein
MVIKLGGRIPVNGKDLVSVFLKITRASLMDHAARFGPSECSQATEAAISQLRMGNFTTGPTSLSEVRPFLTSNTNSRGAQMLAATPPYGTQEQENGCYITAYLGDYGTQEHGSDHYITAHLVDYGTQDHGSDHYITAHLVDYGTQDHGSDHYITAHRCYGAQEQGSAPAFVAGMNSYGA